MTARRWEAVAVAAGLAAVAALFVAYPTYPNYDAYYHLDWGRELLRGHSPSFDAYKAPTQHPLYVLACAALTLLGGHADRVLVALTLVALVALVWGTYRLGARTVGRWPGVAAAAFVGGSLAFVLYALRAYVDVPFLALVVWAAALEAARPRRGAPVLALLALAGLLRPEAWLLGGAYWLWWAGARPPRARALGLAVALAAPALWALTDLAVTGDALHSLHATSDLADELQRNRGIADLPGAFVSFLAGTIKAPVAALGALGAAVAWRRGELRRVALALALFAAGALTFLLTGLAGLSILPRYLTVPAVALCVLAGYALLGFAGLPAGDELRRRWGRAAAVAVVLGAAAFAIQAPAPSRATTELRFVNHVHSDLVSILRAPAVAAARRCGPVTFPNYRLVPDARWVLDAPRGAVGARSARRRDRGVAIFVLGEKALRRLGFAQGASPRTNVPDPGFTPVARNATFAAYAACPP